MDPRISIILPTYNGARTISRSIASVLSQTYADWELIIVSDGSADNTAALVDAFSQKDQRILFTMNEKNLGIQKTLNKGIAISKGKYIARIDDDDAWTDPSKLSAQAAFLESNPDYVLVGTDAFVVNEQGDRLSVNIMPKTDDEIRSKLLSKNCFLHSTIFARKSAIEKAGGYRTFRSEDYDLWLRLGLLGKMANLEMKSTTLIAHGDSLNSKNRVVQAQYALRIMFTYRKHYPHFWSGFFMSIARLTFVSLLKIVPIPTSLWYRIQRFYRSI